MSNELSTLCYLHFLAFACGLTAFVYSTMLTKPGQIFSELYKVLDKYLGKQEWIFNPLIGCYLCVAGQFALWVVGFNILHGSVSFLFLPYFISLSILISWLINREHSK